jgi:tetratricopeptide (TPR) repeat protein
MPSLAITSCARPLALLLFTIAFPAQGQFKLDASLGDLEARARRDSNDAAAHYNVALGYWNAKRFDDTERAFRVALSLDPRFAAPYMGLAFLPYARRPRLRDEVAENRVPEEWEQKVDESRTMLRRAYAIDPFVEVRLGGAIRPRASEFLVELEEIFGEHIRDYFDALDNLFAGEDQKAFDRFQRVYNYVDGDRHPDRLFSDLVWFHGVAAGRAKKWQEAKWDFDLLYERALATERRRRDSLTFAPLQTNEFRYIKALLHQRLEEPNEAIRLYRESLQNDIGLFMAHVHLAEIYEGANMWDEAVLSRRNAINANPDDPTLELDLGWTLVKARRFADAEESLRSAAERSPRDPRAAYYLGLVQLQLGKAADAKTNFQRFIGIAPSRYERQIADAQQRVASLK